MSKDSVQEDWQTHKTSLLERNKHMFNNTLLSDVGFLVGHDEKTAKMIPAHKYVLSISSPVFFAMFTGELAEQGPTIRIPDVDPESFLEFLRYLYTDEVYLSQCVHGLLYLASKYIVPALTRVCLELMYQDLSPGNVLSVLGEAICYDDKELLKRCWALIDSKTSEVLRSDEFLDSPYDIVEQIYKRDTLNTTELELFIAIDTWAVKKCEEKGLVDKRDVLKDLIYQIHYPSISLEDFVCKVLSAEILDRVELSQISQDWTSEGNNVASSVGRKYRQTPRKSTVKYCSRFESGAAPTDLGWCYINSTDENAVPVDGISFSVDKSIRLAGARFYGDQDLSEYTASLQLLDADGKCLAEVPSKKYKSCIERGCSGYDVCFDDAVCLEANKIYHLSARICGPPSYASSNGQGEVICEGSCFKFYDYQPSMHGNGTSVKNGVVPELIFY